jgi:hypothetical protein
VLHVRVAGAEGEWTPPANRHFRVTVLGGAKGLAVDGPR